MPYMIHDADWPDFKRLMNAYRSGRLTQPATAARQQPPGGRPTIRAILLDDLVAGDTVSAAVTKLHAVDEVQVIDLRGEVTGGTFTLTYDGQTTAAIDWDATADALRTALEELSNINPGDVLVTAYAARWLVRFTGQFRGEAAELMTAGNSLTGIYNSIRITSAFMWVDANRTEQIHCQLPVGSPTPLKAGAVVTAGWIPEASRYCIINVECRDLEYESSYGG